MSNISHKFTCCIERCDDSKEVRAFIPEIHLNINLSVGGTKILTAIIDSKARIIWESSVLKWRHERDKIQNMNSLEKRNWFISHMIEEILKAEIYAKRNIENCLFESVGISWPGPILKNGALVGPNIESFRHSDLSKDEMLVGGIFLQKLLMCRLSEMGKSWNVCILNDADAEGSVSFGHEQINHGMLVILGTGIGAGIILNKKCYFGPPDFISRMGEIGQHLVYDKSKENYSYYGVETKGVVLSETKKPTMQDRLAGPAVAMRFLDQLYTDFHKNVKLIKNYLNFYLEAEHIEEWELIKYYDKAYVNLNTEEKILKLITKKARLGDSRSNQFISNIGYEIGLALGVFISHFKSEPYVKYIKLAGSLGQYFGLDVRNLYGSDLFIDNIQNGINASVNP